MTQNTTWTQWASSLVAGGLCCALLSGCAAKNSQAVSAPEPQRLAPADADPRTVILADAGLADAGDAAEWRIHGSRAPRPHSPWSVALAAAESAIDAEEGRARAQLNQLTLPLPDDAVLDPRTLCAALRGHGYRGTLLVVGVLTSDGFGIGSSTGSVEVGVEAWNIESGQRGFAEKKVELRTTPILWVAHTMKLNGQPSEWARTTISKFVGELVPAALARGTSAMACASVPPR